MSSHLKKWALRFVLAMLALATAFALLLTVGVSTESGTRWLLAQVARLAPIEIDTERTRGTLLTDLFVPAIRYSDPDRLIVIDDLSLNIDWSRTSVGKIVIEHLAVRQFSLDNIGDKPPEPSPLEISMPALPVGIQVDNVTLDAMIFDDLNIAFVSAQAVALYRQQIRATFATASIDAVSVDLHDFDIELGGDVPLNTVLEWRIAGTPWSGMADISGSLKKLAVVHDLAGEYPAHSEGTVELLQRTEPLADLVTEFDDWRYQEWTLSDGIVRIIGTTNDYRSTIAATVSDDETLSATISGVVTGNTRGLGTLDLTIDTAIAQARATGSVDWAPQLAIDVLLSTDNLDPSTFAPVATGAINSEVRITVASAEDFAIDIISLDGTWNEYPASGQGRLSRQADAWQCAGCRVHVGENSVAADGEIDAGALAGSVDIDAPSLQQLWPGIAGSLLGDGRVRGSLTLPILSGEVSGSKLAFADWNLASLTIQSSNSTPENIDFTVEAGGLSNGETSLGGGRLQLAGAPSSADLTAKWTRDDFAARTRVQLAVDGETVTGRILSASLTEPYNGAWTTAAPIAFVFAPGLLNVERGDWANGNTQLSHERLRVASDRIEVIAALSDGSLAVLNGVLPERIRIDGFADATVNVSRQSNGWTGDITWQQRETSVRFQSGREDEYVLQVPVADATIRLQDNALDLQAVINAQPGLEATLDATLDDLSKEATLDAQLQMSGDQWEWVAVLFPDVDNVEGDVSANILATGAAASPDLSGELRWQRGRLAMPALNLPLREIDIVLTGTSAGTMSISGSAMSGGGSLAVNGQLENIASKSPSFNVELTGDNADLLNWPDYQLTASPNLTFAGNTAGVKVAGRVDLDKAEIRIRDLPEGAVSISDDVTVIGRDEQVREQTRISGEVDITLSDNIHIQAFGLDTNLEGELRFTVPEDREPQAAGEVRLIGGVFEAYGQRLEIERGTMIFTGPLDDPIINVRAIRKIDGVDGTVTAGIQLTGRARNISSTVFADPSMSEADALSYLVLGRPLEDATAADGSNLSNTAYALGLRQAALITNQIGQTVGLDELRVSGSNQNTTELVAGKQVNSRLYARYAYGVFTRLGHLLLRYRLSESFFIEVGAGETQSMDILYTIEKE